MAQDRRRIRQGVPAQMVVRYDHVHPQLPGQADLLQGLDAVVHREDQLGARLGQLLHRSQVHAIALPVPGGDMVKGLGPQLFQGPQHDGRGAHTVHIVVPVYADPLPLFRRLPEPGHGLVHIPEQKGIV